MYMVEEVQKIFGELKGGSFVRLLEALVESVLYCMGWRCGGVVDRLVHLSRYIEMRAARFFGLGL